MKIVSLTTYGNPTFDNSYVADAIHTIDCILFVGDKLDNSIEECNKMKMMLKKWDDKLDSKIKYIKDNSIDTMKGKEDESRKY